MSGPPYGRAAAVDGIAVLLGGLQWSLVEKGRQRGIPAGIERLRRAQAFGQPAGIGDEPFSLRCHFLLLQIGDQLGGVVTLRLPHVSDDLRPGNAVEIILRACHPAGLRHVKTDCGCELITMTHTM